MRTRVGTADALRSAQTLIRSACDVDIAKWPDDRLDQAEPLGRCLRAPRGRRNQRCPLRTSSRPAGSLSRPTRSALGSAEENELQRLAQLSVLEYERNRRDVAKRLGIKVATLDLEVASRRGDVGGKRLGTFQRPWPQRDISRRPALA